MSPKAAGDLWEISHQAVTSACKDGRIAGVAKDSSGHFIIPIDTWKPLDRESIRKVLVSLLAIKNRPGSQMLDQNGSNELFQYLHDIGLLEGNDLWTASLTNRAMEIATSGERIQIDWPNAAVTILGVLGSLASLWSAIPK